MQVISKLIKMEFRIGSVERDGDQLVIISDPRQPLRSKVYLSADDVASVIRAAFTWPVITFLAKFPFLYFKSRRGKPAKPA